MEEHKKIEKKKLADQVSQKKSDNKPTKEIGKKQPAA